MKLSKITKISALILLSLSSVSHARSYNLPPANEAIIGKVSYTTSSAAQTTFSLASKYNLGQNAIIAANPGLTENSRLPEARNLTVPSQFMLPPGPREGIVVNLPEMRMYYYPKGSHTVMTYPIGIGKIGKTIPIRNTEITRKVVNPSWTPPADIRQFDRERGIELPKTMGPGPDNPLGPYAIYLKIPTYLIHSTIFPESLGSRGSFGCIRMNEDDIREFFPQVQPGIPVSIIDLPTKVAWQKERLYIEAHPPLEERTDVSNSGVNGAMRTVQENLPHEGVVVVNWQLVSFLAERPDGLPHEIGVKVE